MDSTFGQVQSIESILLTEYYLANNITKRTFDIMHSGNIRINPTLVVNSVEDAV